ncbi:MAG: response regulator, partial [Bacteroidota bacterium]
LNYMRDILTNEYEIMTAKDGVEAWEIIQADLPDIVVSDIMMPRMNGLDLTQHIRKEQSTCHIPVILLTARISIENKLEGLEAGADAYIPKPFNESHLLTRIRKLLEMRKLIAEHYREHLTFDIIKEGVDRMDQHFLDRTNSIITQNIGEQDFGVKELSREVGMSRVHLYRKIKQITELSVSEYIRSIKLSYAKNLISKGELTISEVAYEAGFSNPSYFTKSFKNQFHLTPSEYQSQITKNLDS